MSLSITPRLIMDAAAKRGWQVMVLDEKRDLYKLTTEDNIAYYIRNITSYKGSGVGGFIAGRKELAFELIRQANLATLPATLEVIDEADAQSFLTKYATVVVKPSNQSHGDGITVDITTADQLAPALELARSFDAKSKVLIQQQITGDDYRLLFIGGKLAAAAIREPASVIGDGVHTMSELIATENQSETRGIGYDKQQTLIDEVAAQQYLGSKLQDVPAAGDRRQVVGTANIGKGGLAIDITATVSQTLVDDAKRLIDHFKIELCGVDYLVTADGQAYFIELNTAPSLGLHEYPIQGQARQTPDAFLDWLTS